MSSDILANVSRAVRENEEMKKIYNWVEISKLELPDLFIDEHHDCLNWDIMSKHQRFSITIMKKYEYLVNFGFLVLNKNNSPEVLSEYIDKMDWETAQKEQNLTPELLTRFRDSIETLVVFQHQKLTEEYINSILKPYIDEKNWDLVRKYLTIVFTYQKVSTEFVLKFLALETQINQPADTSAVTSATPLNASVQLNASQVINTTPPDPQPEIILVDLPVVVRNQQLSSEFLSTFCMEFTEVRREICKSQKLTTAFISENFEKLNTRRLLKYQQMDEPTLVRICEQFVYRPVMTDAIIQALTGSTSVANNMPAESEKEADRRFIMGNALVNNQRYNMEMFKNIVNAFPDHPRWQEVLWGNVFLRTLNPIGSEKYLGLSADTVMQEIIPNVNWDMVAECDLETEQIDSIIDNVSMLGQIPWYKFVKKHTLNEQQLSKLDEADCLTHMTWWTVLRGNEKREDEKKLSEFFMRKHAAKLLWIPQVDAATFYPAWLKAKDNLDNIDVDDSDADININVRERHLLEEIRDFMPSYVEQADWRKILREVQLPEWAMRVFAEYSDKIDMYWWKISRYQKLTQSFIDKHIAELDLQIVLGYQDVTEEFLREKRVFFTDENWDAVARHQKLSTQFLEDFTDKLPIDELAKNQHV
jgi:hypothetical protein